MKLRNAVKVAALAGVAAMLPVTVQADLGLPDFGKWAVLTDANNTGVITGCPVLNACTTLVSGEGFLQQEFVDTRGTAQKTYINTIVTDPEANGVAGAIPYSDESFVIADGSSSGVAGQQSIFDGSSNFEGITNLYTGWAGTDDGNPDNGAELNLGDGSSMVVNQYFFDAGGVAVGDEFRNDFDLKISLDAATGNQIGKNMTIKQGVGMGDGVVPNSTDMQNFVVAQASGTQVATAGTVTLLATGDKVLDETAAWGASDDIMVTWLGQNVTADPTTGELAIFGYERVTNRTVQALPDTDPLRVNFEASAFSTTTTDLDAAPFAWTVGTTGLDTIFGAKPVLTMPVANP